MTSPLIIPDVASLPGYEGRDLGQSSWHVVDQARIDAFATATGGWFGVTSMTVVAVCESPASSVTVSDTV